MTTVSAKIKGGQFLLQATNAADIFIPEEFNEEQQMMRDMTRDFLAHEVIPFLDRIDQQEEVTRNE